MVMVFQQVRPKCPKSPKSAQNDQKIRFFHKKRKSLHVHASTGGKAVFYGYARHLLFSSQVGTPKVSQDAMVFQRVGTIGPKMPWYSSVLEQFQPITVKMLFLLYPIDTIGCFGQGRTVAMLGTRKTPFGVI